MGQSLNIAEGLSLPIDAVTRRFSILAMTGAGKSYTGAVMFEEIHAAQQRAVVLDPMGAWWGLRSSADGKSPGLPVVVLGGDHGDAPLAPDAGALVADLAVHESFSLVLDLKGMTRREQVPFAAAFLSRFLHLNRDPIHLFLDEVDLFAPEQQKFKGQSESLDAVEGVVRRGRGNGVGVTMLTQRAAEADKGILAMVDAMVVLRTLSPQDRDAMDRWVKRHASPEQREEFLGSLGKLKTGEAWVWSPEWLEVFQRVRVRARRTYDSGATPKVGEARRAPKRLAEVDMARLRERLAATIARAAAEDPAMLRARIAELEGDLAQAQRERDLASDEQAAAASALASAVRTETKVVEVPVVLDAQKNDLRALADELTSGAARMERFAQDVAKATDGLRTALETADSVSVQHAVVRADAQYEDFGTVVPPPTSIRPEPASRFAPSRAGRAMGEGATNGKLGGGEQRVLANVYRFDARGGLTKVQLATLSGLKSSGGGFNNYLGRLRSGLGYVEIRGDRYHCTESGRRYAAHVWPTLPALRQADILALWMGKLGGGERRIMDLLLRTYPRALAKSEIAKAVGLEVGGGGFNNYLGKLRSNALAENHQGGLRAGPALFLR